MSNCLFHFWNFLISYFAKSWTPVNPGPQVVHNVHPVLVHSHNDEGRKQPLWEALSLGCACIEPDVILEHGSFHIGHDRSEVKPGKTLRSMYLDPLHHLLKELYPEKKSGIRSVYPSAPDFSLLLNLDFKYFEQGNLAALIQDLEPLYTDGFLTTVTDGKLKKSSITIVATGSYPTEEILAMEPRYVFLDAPLGNLSAQIPWSPLISPMASGDAKKFGWNALGFRADTARMSEAVAQAHALGLTARWWGLAAIPKSLRNRGWEAALESGADWLNADDLVEATALMRSRTRRSHDEV